MHVAVGSLVACAAIAAHPWIGRVADGPARVLLRAIPVFTAAGIALYAWSAWRWSSLHHPEWTRVTESPSWYRPLYAMDLLTAGCLALAAGCAGVTVVRSHRRPALVAGVLLLAGAACRAAMTARETGWSLRHYEEMAARRESGDLTVNWSPLVTTETGYDTGSAIFVGVLLLGAATAVLACARPAGPAFFAPGPDGSAPGPDGSAPGPDGPASPASGPDGPGSPASGPGPADASAPPAGR